METAFPAIEQTEGWIEIQVERKGEVMNQLSEKKSRIILVLMSVAVLGTLSVSNNVAMAQTGLCTDVFPPADRVPGFVQPLLRISKPGYYCLGSDVRLPEGSAFASVAIQVDADHVVLDLNGFIVSGSALYPDIHVRGIEIRGNHVIVRNGVVKDFGNGIDIRPGTEGGIIEKLRVVDTVSAFAMYGIGAVLRDNYLRGTRRGFHVEGAQTSITNNVLTGVAGTGIYVSPSVRGEGSVIIRGNSLFGGGTGVQILWFESVLIENNQIADLSRGIDIRESSSKPQRSTYRNNSTLNVRIPYFGGIDGGNNL